MILSWSFCAVSAAGAAAAVPEPDAEAEEPEPPMETDAEPDAEASAANAGLERRVSWVLATRASAKPALRIGNSSGVKRRGGWTSVQPHASNFGRTLIWNHVRVGGVPIRRP